MYSTFTVIAMALIGLSILAFGFYNKKLLVISIFLSLVLGYLSVVVILLMLIIKDYSIHLILQFVSLLFSLMTGLGASILLKLK